MTKLTQMAVIFAALTTSVALVSVDPRGRSAHAKTTNMTRDAAEKSALTTPILYGGVYYLGPQGGTSEDCDFPVADEADCKDAYDAMSSAMGLSTFDAGGQATLPRGCIQLFGLVLFNRAGSGTHSFTSPVCRTYPVPATAANQATVPAVAAVGDPHMQNILGQRFDLAQPGEHTLLQIPRGASASDALLRVTADAKHEGGACSDMYFKALNITGLWVSAPQKDGYIYTAGAPQPVVGWRRFGKVEVKVAWGRTLGGVEYLNFMVRHLTRVGQDVGGLLGMDDYTQAAKRDPSCGSAILVQLYSAPQEASFAMADM